MRGGCVPTDAAIAENRDRITAFATAHKIAAESVDPTIMILDVLPRERKVMVKLRRPSCCCTLSIYDKVGQQWSLTQTIRVQELEDAHDAILTTRSAPPRTPRGEWSI